MGASDRALLDRLDEVFRNLFAGTRGSVIAVSDDYPENEIRQGVVSINRFLGEFSHALSIVDVGCDKQPIKLTASAGFAACCRKMAWWRMNWSAMLRPHSK